MIKAIAIITKTPGVTRAQFAERYERDYAPLVRKIMPGLAGYRRNYVEGQAAGGTDAGSEIPFDAVVEMTFPDEAAFKAFQAAAADPAIAAQIDPVRNTFLDKDSIRFFRVREDVLPIPLAPGEPQPTIKAMILLNRLAKVTLDQFHHYYDNNHAPFMGGLLPWIRVYNRNHILGPPVNDAAVIDDLPSPANTVTELRFRDEDSFQAFRSEFAKPEVMAQIRADEANFLDFTKSRLFRVREAGSL